MIRSSIFWEKEKEAPILNRNGDYITEENGDEFCKRVEHFYELMRSYIDEEIDVEVKEDCDDPEIRRIIQLDAVRTFNSEENRKLLVTVLQSIFPIVQDYHQGVSFISSFLLLFLEPKEVVKIVIGLHKHYLQGYFKAMPKAYVRDARVFLLVLKHFHPKLNEHLNQLITPEAFASKWFIGLNVHVLTFESLLLFFEHLLKEGEMFLFKYSVALCRVLEPELMKTKDVSRILGLLRLDRKIFPNNYKENESQEVGEFFTNIVYTAVDIDMSEINLEKLRAEADAQLLREEERRKQIELEQNMSDDEIVFSDEEDENNNDEEDENDNDEEDEKNSNNNGEDANDDKSDQKSNDED